MYAKTKLKLKYGFCKKSLRKNDQLNTFATYLSSLLGVIAIVFSNHAQKWGQICCKSGQLVRVSSFRNDFVTKSILWYELYVIWTSCQMLKLLLNGDCVAFQLKSWNSFWDPARYYKYFLPNFVALIIKLMYNKVFYHNHSTSPLAGVFIEIAKLR